MTGSGSFSLPAIRVTASPPNALWIGDTPSSIALRAHWAPLEIPRGGAFESVMLFTVEVRVATVNDAVAVTAVHVRSWQNAYRGLLPDAYLDGLSVERRSEVWSRILSETDLPRTGTFVLHEGLDVIGFVHVAPTRDDDLPASTGEVTGIYITPSAWRLGGGRQLMDSAKASLKAAGFATAALWVLEANLAARAFYERQGWVPDGARKVDDRGDFVLLVQCLLIDRTLP
jgi:GNAT superfamily N-acetyltransferase